MEGLDLARRVSQTPLFFPFSARVPQAAAAEGATSAPSEEDEVNLHFVALVNREGEGGIERENGREGETFAFQTSEGIPAFSLK